MNKDTHKRRDALSIARRIRVDDSIRDRKKWYIATLAPVLLLIGLYFDWQNLGYALGLFGLNFVLFYYRMWTWKQGDKMLELLVLPAGLIAIAVVVGLLVQKEAFSAVSVLWLLGAFFTPIFIMRTLTAKQVNDIADALESKYK